MRILHYVDENRLARGETWIQLIKELNEQGTENHVVCKSGGTLAGRLKEEGLSFDTCGVPVAWLPWTFSKLGRIIDNFAPEIIHTRLSSAARIGGYWGKRKGLAVVQTVDKYHKAHYHKNASFLIACSESINTHMLKNGFKNDMITVIHNPVNEGMYKRDDKMRAVFREKFGVSVNTKVILTARRFAWWKGFDVLLKAYYIALNKKNAADSVIMLLGDGEEEEEQHLKNLTEKLGLKDKIIMPGFVHDIRPYLWASDIFVLPSKTPEPFGIILLEAMASGLAPIATMDGGPLDIIENGINGWLVDINNPDALSKKLYDALENSDLVKNIAINAAERACDFNVTEIARKTIAIYEKVLDTRAYSIQNMTEV